MNNEVSREVSADRKASYRVSICEGLSSGNVATLVSILGGRRSLFVTTPTVARLYSFTIVQQLRDAGVDINLSILSCNEHSKTLLEVEKLCQECFRVGLDRQSVLIACGGGVCGDIVTMAASLTRRGLCYIRIPTTLIGLIDAGIGIKGAVNLPGKKSGMGCFHPPERVLLDPAFLQTLPKRYISDGLAEAIKVAAVLDADLLAFIEAHCNGLLNLSLVVETEKMNELMWRCTLHTLRELELNLYEDKTYCRLLDFGHTFSPLIESESDFSISHGAAVAIDIATSTAIAFEIGLISVEERDRVLALLGSAGLPIHCTQLSVENAHRALTETEAHRGGHLNLVLPSGIGRGIFVLEKGDIAADVMQRALDFLKRQNKLPRIQPSSISNPRFDTALG